MAPEVLDAAEEWRAAPDWLRELGDRWGVPVAAIDAATADAYATVAALERSERGSPASDAGEPMPF